MTNKARDFLEKYGKPGVHFPEEYVTLKNWCLSNDQSDKCITNILKPSKNSSDKIEALKHQHVTEKHIHIALDDPDPEVRYSAIKNYKSSEKNLEKALEDSDADVRFASIIHPKISRELLQKASVEDGSEYNQKRAIKRLNNVK